MAGGLLLDIGFILAASALVVFLLQRLRQPAILGYLIAGAVIGPYGTRLVTDLSRIEHIADIGVLLLMFAIGLETSLGKLGHVRRYAIVGGALQIVLTVVVSVAALRAFGMAINRAVFIGCTIAMSSTAIVLKSLQERGEQDAPHGRIALGILIFQDLAVVPLMVILREVVRPDTGEVVAPALAVLGKALGALLVALALARFVVPFVFDQIARTRSRELFSVAVLGILLVAALATDAAGLSAALGAFIAGLALGGTDYDHEARAIVGPFRDAFAGVFFVSIGMLLQPVFIFDHPAETAFTVALVLVINTLVSFLALIAVRCPVRIAVLVAFAISQVGEFGFVIAKMGREAKLIKEEGYQLTIAVSVLTMLLTPVMLWLGEKLSTRVSRVLKDAAATGDIPAEVGAALDRHAVLCGYGPMGRGIAMGLRANGVPLVVLELNAVTVQAARAEGISIFYADATQPEVLDRVAIERAKAILVTVPDPIGAKAVVRAARERAPNATIAVRTKYASDARALLDLGADEVVVEELETGLEMLARTLRVFDVPRARIAAHLDEARAVTREQGREINVRGKKLGEITRVLRRVEVEIVEVSIDSPLDGATVGRAVREAEGASVLAVLRGQETVTAPAATFKLARGDRIVVFGGGAQVAALEALAVQVVKKEEAEA